MDDWRKIPMKFPGTCIVCDEKIKVNEIAWWGKRLGVKHVGCVQPTKDNSDTKNYPVLPTNFTLEHEGVFKIIDEPEIIEEQQKMMQKYFKKSPSKSGKIRLTNKGTKSHHSPPYFPEPDAYFHSQNNFWWTDGIDPVYKQFIHKTREEFENPKTFKNILGIGEPQWDFNKNSYPILEINFNKEPPYRTAGYILENRGNYFLGISKNIGGHYKTTSAGLYSSNAQIKKYFLDHNSPILTSPEPIFLIAKIDEDSFAKEVSEFVKNVKKIKDILSEYHLKDLEKLPKIILSTYSFDEQYEKESIDDLIKLENSKISEVELDAEIKKIDSEIDSNPQKQEISTSGFVRNQKLSNRLKMYFKHTCQLCEKTTFKTKAGHFYTEHHHIVPLAMNGSPKSENILIVCANCHRKFDSGDEETLVETYKKLINKNLISIPTLKKLKTVNAISENMFKEIIPSN